MKQKDIKFRWSSFVAFAMSLSNIVFATGSSSLFQERQELLQNREKILSSRPKSNAEADSKASRISGSLLPKAAVSTSGSSRASAPVMASNVVQGIESFVSSSFSFSSSDYVNGLNQVLVKEYSAPATASQISLTFTLIDLETNFDYVRVYDSHMQLCDSFTGRYANGVVSTACAGNYAAVYVKTDANVSGSAGYSGFQISGYTYTQSPYSNSPVALGTADNYTVTDGQPVSFDASHSFDPDPNDFVAHYRWEFGDGTSSGEIAVPHTYATPGTYQVKLTVWDNGGNQHDDFFTLVVNPVSPVTALSLASSTARSLTASWKSGGEEATAYSVSLQKGNSPSLDCSLGTDVGNNTSFKFGALTPNTEYTIAVCAYNSYSKQSVPLLLHATTPLLVLPPSPNSLIASAIGAHQFQLNWNSGNGNTAGFYVNIAQGNIAPNCANGTGTGVVTNQVFSGLSANTNYAVSVCAINSDGDFSSSATLKVTTALPPAPPTPINFQVTALYANRFTVIWDSAGANTSGFLIRMYPGAVAPTCFGGNSVGVDLPSQSYQALNPSSAYTVAICAVDTDGDTSVPLVQTITTPAAPPIPSQVAGLVAAHVGMLDVSLTWASGGGSSSYYRLSYAQGAVAPRCSSGGINVGTNTSYTVTGLTGKTQYTFAVCALNNIDVSSPAATIQILTLDGSNAPNPKSLVSTGKTANSINLAWATGGGSTVGYRVAYQQGSAPRNCTSGIDTQTPNAILQGLNYFASYGIRVCAVNGLGKFSSGIVLTVKTLDNQPQEVRGLYVAGQGHVGIDLAWLASQGQGGGNYLVTVAQGNTPPSSCTGGSVVALNKTGVSIIRLASDTTYSFRICSKNGDGIISNGVTTSSYTIPFAPPDPSGLIATEVTESTASLSWTTGGGYTSGFKVAYKSGATAPRDCAGATGGDFSSIDFTQLEPYALYSFRVCATDDYGQNSPGVTLTIMTLDTQNQGLDNFAYKSATPDTLNLQWEYPRPNKAGTFQLSWKAGMVAPEDCNGGQAIPLRTRTAAVPKLRPDSYYSFRLCLYNGNNVYTQGLVLEGLRTFKLPAPDPTQVSSSNAGDRGTLTFSWRTGGGITDTFKIAISDRGYPAEFCTTGINVGNANSFLYSRLKSGRAYYVRVCSVNNDGVVSRGAGSYTAGVPQ